jgi:hypothetical protein
MPALRLGICATLVATLALAACGSSSNNATSTTTKKSGASTTAGGVSPNTPESSPSGDIPDNQVYVPYTDPSGPFTVKVPEGWARRSTGRVVSFTDKLNTIALETVNAASAPTVASANAGELPTIARTVKSYKAGTTTAKSRTGGPTVLIQYQADSSPDAVTGKVIKLAVLRYEFWRNGKEGILTLSGPVTADNVDPWNLVSNSFTWK